LITGIENDPAEEAFTQQGEFHCHIPHFSACISQMTFVSDPVAALLSLSDDHLYTKLTARVSAV